jgi:branched-chain amino acid aminotransferase
VSELAQANRAASEASLSTETWRVRPASHGDIGAVAVAVRELLLELGGTPAALPEMEAATRVLLDDQTAGAVLVATARDGVVGVLAMSWQTAIHVPGSYALIQDLWVHPRWRGKGVGRGLLDALLELAGNGSFQRVEVGLPRESFAQFAATEAFYLGNGFTPNGPRMRRMLS